MQKLPHAIAILTLLFGFYFVFSQTQHHQYPPQDWNDKGVSWVSSYDDAVKQAKATRKPICLVFYALWCPHCRNYAHVFADPAVVAKSRNFVMLRVDVDAHPVLNNDLRPDGAYVPRTYFLTPEGILMPDLAAAGARTADRYFYSESNPVSISQGMDRALAATQ